MIRTFLGTIGSGKSYHALEEIIEALNKGLHVVSNFPLNFTEAMIKKGYADRFMYVPDDFLTGTDGVAFLFQLQKKMNFYENGGEGACLVIIDEAGNYFPPEDNGKISTKLWKLFFTQSRKMGYDFLLICQDDQSQINKTIRKCVEYRVVHRKANNVFPFNLLPFTLFMYVTFWAQTRERLKSNSSIYVKRFGALYNTSMMFGDIESAFDLDLESLKSELGFSLEFGNCDLTGQDEFKTPIIRKDIIENKVPLLSEIDPGSGETTWTDINLVETKILEEVIQDEETGNEIAV